MIRRRPSILSYLWVAPVSAIGLALLPLVRLTGGRARVVDGVLELDGGILARLLPRLGPDGGISAITVGHVVLARDAPAAAATRDHERVHVTQYQRWGPFFPAVYGIASVAAWLAAGHPYRDNVFELQARAAASGYTAGVPREAAR